MLAADFIRKVYVPLGMLAVAVAFVLGFLVDPEHPPSDNLIAAIVGGTLFGTALLYGLYRAVTGPRGRPGAHAAPSAADAGRGSRRLS